MPRPRKNVPAADVQFAENLRVLRAGRSLSLDQLAGLSGVAATAIWKAERSQRKVSIGEAATLAEALGVALEAMLTGPLEVVLTVGPRVR